MGAVAIAKMDIRRLIRSPKLYLLLCFKLYFLLDFTKEISTYAQTMQLGVSPYIYPLFYGDWMTRTFAMLVIVGLMSDAPYMDENQKYTWIRSGSNQWILGKLLYIIGISFGYQFLVILLSVAVLIPYVAVSMEWGDILKNLAMGAAGMEVSLGNVTSMMEIQQNFSGPVATILTWFLAAFVSMAVGIFIFLVNGICKNALGTVLALIFCMADLFVSAMKDAGISLSIPVLVSYMDLSSIYTTHVENGKMFMGTVVAGLLIFCIVVIGLLWIAVRKKKIEIV